MLITPGLLTALGIFILIMKMRRNTMRKLLGFDIYLDIGVTVLLMIVFAGTFAGMMAAIVGGIAFSVALWCAKMLVGYQKLTIVQNNEYWWPTLMWTTFPGILKAKEEKV